MSNQFFNIYTYTPWDGLNTNELTLVKLLSLKTVFKSFPVIQEKFFNDLTLNISKNAHYSWFQTIKRIVGPNMEDYDIVNWNFVWAIDDQSRMFQFLFQKKEEQGVLVALAPPELGKLFSKHGKGAILRILSLLNNPAKITFLMILAPKGKSIAQEQQLFHMNKQQFDTLKYFQQQKNLPNIQGQWFPTFKIRCPNCGQEIVALQNYIGFDKLKCPFCGYEKN